MRRINRLSEHIPCLVTSRFRRKTSRRAGWRWGRRSTFRDDRQTEKDYYYEPGSGRFVIFRYDPFLFSWQAITVIRTLRTDRRIC